MPDQILFSLGKKTSYNVDDFFVSPENELALKQIMLFPNWGADRLAGICMIIGPAFSGKTHLAHIFASLAGAKFIDEKFLRERSKIDKFQALVIDDFDQKLDYEEEIFHIFNDCLDQKKFLLILSSRSEFSFKTKDLASRIQAINSIRIGDPSLELIEAILYKNFADRQISISPEVIKFILSRMERSYLVAHEIIERIDQKSLKLRSKINMALAKEVLQSLEESSSRDHLQ